MHFSFKIKWRYLSFNFIVKELLLELGESVVSAVIIQV